MTTITVDNVPAELVKKRGDHMDYETYNKKVLKEKIAFLKDALYDPTHETYGPFHGEKAIDFLKILDYEDTL